MCLILFYTTFNNISIISWLLSFIGGGNHITQRKTTDILQVIDIAKFIIML